MPTAIAAECVHESHNKNNAAVKASFIVAEEITCA